MVKKVKLNNNKVKDEKKDKKKKAGLIAGGIIVAGLLAGGTTVGIIAANAKVTLKYETGLDSVSFKNETIKKGGKANLPPIVRPGYKFLGWYLDADGNVPATASTKFNKDTTLYAQWRANEYTITLKDEELGTEIETPAYKGTYNDKNLNSLNLPILANVSLYDYDKPLYTFNGWKNETGTLVADVWQSFNNTTIPYKVNLYGETLYAAWEGIEVDIYFGNEVVATKKLGETITLEQGDDAQFYNWAVNAASGYNWKKLGAPGATIKLTKDLLTVEDSSLVIKYDKPVIEFSAETGTNSEPEYIVLGDNYTATEELEEVSREGYSFGGWYLDAGFKTRVVKTAEEATKLGLEEGEYVVGIPTDTGRVVLYANMKPNDVTIKYNYGNVELRDGYSSQASDVVKAGSTILLPAHARSYAGFNIDFVGWEYNGTRQTIGEAFVVPTNVKEITLNAVWGSAYNLLNFNLQGGIITGDNKIEYNYNELKTYTMPNVTLTKLGYEFVGWSLDPNTLPSDTSNIIKANGEYTVMAQTTLYAIWRARQFEIAYNLNGGTIAASNQVDVLYGNDITLSNTPTRPGYRFVRWDVTYYTDSGASYLVPIADKGVLSVNSNALNSTALTTKINVAAVWEANNYFFVINNLVSENDAKFIHIEDANGNSYEYNVSGVTIPYDSTITIDVNGTAANSIAAKAHFSKVVGLVLDDGSLGTNAETGAYTANKMYNVSEDNNNVISFTFADFGDDVTAGRTVNYKINREADRVKVKYVYKDAAGNDAEKLEDQTAYYDIASTATGNSASVLNLKAYKELSGAETLKNSAGKYFYYWVVNDVDGNSHCFDGNGVPVSGKPYADNLFIEIDNPEGVGDPILSINSLVGDNDTITIEAFYGEPVYATIKYVDYNGDIVDELKYDVTAETGSLKKEININENANVGEVNGTAMPTSTRDGYDFNGWSKVAYNVVKNSSGNWVVDSKYVVSDSVEVENTTNLEKDLVKTVYAHYTAKSYDVIVKDEQTQTTYKLSEQIVVQPNDDRISKTYSLSRERILGLASEGKIETLFTDSETNKKYDLIGFTTTAGQKLGSAATSADVIIYGTQGSETTPKLGKDADGNDVLYIYVVWGEQQYKYIEYNANNGTGSTQAQLFDMTDAAIEGATQYSYGYDTVLHEVTVGKGGDEDHQFAKAPTRVGYTFAGWANESGTIVETITFSKFDPEANSDRTYRLYAQWTPNKYDVVYFNANNNISERLKGELAFDANYTLSKTLGAVNGNDFAGWAYGLNVGNAAQVVTATSHDALNYLISGSIKIDNVMLAKLLEAAGAANEAAWVSKSVNFYPIFATPVDRYVTMTNLSVDDTKGFETSEETLAYRTGIYGGVVKYGEPKNISAADLINDLNANKRIIRTHRIGSISYVDANGVTQTTSDGFISLTWGAEAPVLTLNWVEDQVELTFDLNDGSGTKVTILSIINSSALIEDRLTAASSTVDVSAAQSPAHKDGNDENGYAYYTFLGWASTPNAEAAEWVANVTGDDNKYTQTNKVATTLYAVWKENFVTIDFEAGHEAVSGPLPTSVRLVANSAMQRSRAASTYKVSDYKLWEDDTTFNLANYNFGGWTYSLDGENTQSINVGDTIDGDILGGLVTGGAKNNHLVLTANWKKCLTDGTNGTVNYFKNSWTINWEKVEAMEGYNGEISLPKTIHGAGISKLSTNNLNINNHTVKAVYLPKTITSIEEGGIVSDALTTLVIPSTVSRIAAGAIVSSNLTSITIANRSVVLSGNPVIASANATTHKLATYNLKTYENDTAASKVESNYTYQIVDGCVLNTAGNSLIAVPQTYDATSFNFSQAGLTGITSIETYAFSGVEKLTTLIFADSITSASEKAICHMPNLTSFVLSNTTPISQLNLFGKGVTKLTTMLGGHQDGLYAGDDGNLYNTSANDIAKYKANTTSVTLNSNYSIGAYALDGLEDLTSITLNNGTDKFTNQISQIDAVANTVVIDWTSPKKGDVKVLSNPIKLTIGESATSLPADAFRNSTRLSELTLGSNITSVGTYSFADCTGLTKIDFRAAKYSGYSMNTHMFDYAGQLSEGIAVSFGEQATYIPSEMFCFSLSYDWNPNITSVVIGNNVTSIGSYAFLWCSTLKNLVIGEGVTSIGQSAFNGCRGLTKIEYNATECNALTNNTTAFYFIGTESDGVDIIIGDNVTKIPAYLFSGSTSTATNNVNSITIGKSVTSIGSNAFQYCAGITKINFNATACADLSNNSSYHPFYYAKGDENGVDVTFADNVTKIPASLFYYGVSPKIKTITIGNGVTTIGNYAFIGCSALTDITFGSSVERIGESAFYNCSSLTSLTMPNSVTSIGKSAFYGAETLESLTIASSVTSIGSQAFYNSKALTTLNFNATSCADFGSNSNVFYDIGMETDGTTVTFGENVTKISSYMFYASAVDHSNIVSVSMPNTVTEIGQYAFENCTALANIALSSNVETIGTRAFYKCGLTSLTIPETVTSIGNYAFNYNERLTNVSFNAIACPDFTSTPFASAGEAGNGVVVTFGNKVTKVPAYLFSGCSKVASVSISESIASIGKQAFYGCTEITEIVFNATNCADLTSKDTVFRSAGTDTDGVTVTIGNNVTKIPAYLFHGYLGYGSGEPNITNLSIGSKVESIGAYAFYSCKTLTALVLPNSVKTIGDYAFANSNNVTNLTLSNNLTSIGSSAFSGCYATNDLVIPNSVTSMGSYAFAGIKSTNITIGSGLTEINSGAFSGCPNLLNIVIPDGITRVETYAFNNCTALKNITIGSGVTSIKNNAFAGTKALTELKINATSMYDCASDVRDYSHPFYEMGSESSGVSVIFGDNVTKIPAYLFHTYYSSDPKFNITSVTIGTSVSRIGDYAFSHCSNIHELNYNARYCLGFSDSSTHPFSALQSNNIDDLKVTIGSTVQKIYPYTFYSCRITNLIFNNDVMSSIDEYAFFGGRFPSVNIPNSVTSIGVCAFRACSLTSVTIPESVTEIGDSAFASCTALTTINYNANVTKTSTTAASHYVFENAGKNSPNGILLTIGDNVEKIPAFLFSGGNDTNYARIRHAIIGKNLTFLGSQSFSHVLSLEKLEINAKNFSADFWAFFKAGTGTDGLEVIFGNEVTRIPSGLFDAGASTQAPNIISVKIGNSVTTIGEKAFASCATLKRIYIPSNVTTIAPSSSSYSPFVYCSSDLQIACGASSKPAGWSDGWNGSITNITWGASS